MIYLNNVSKTYPNGTVGIKPTSLSIEKGEFVFITGNSGSGKSTLLKLMLKEIEPTHGKISINNKEITKLRRRQVPYLRRDIGVVFQDFRLLPNKTVYENVAFAMQVVQATNLVGESTCWMIPSFNTTIRVPSVIASTWSCVT